MVDRVIVALLLVAILAAVYVTWSRWRLARAQRTDQAPGLETRKDGQAAILYFSTPDCVPCKTRQAPALDELQVQLNGHVQIIKIDAEQQREIADYWGVLSVPTTFIIDREGKPRRVNDGVASAEKLRAQLSELEIAP